MSKFKIGDRVVAVRPTYYILSISTKKAYTIDDDGSGHFAGWIHFAEHLYWCNPNDFELEDIVNSPLYQALL